MLSDATSGASFSAGCSRSSTVMVGAPPVVRLITTSAAALIFGRNCLKTSGSCVGRPSFGMRACRCTIAAPAFAAPIAPSAISSGVIGRCGDIVGVWMAPVTAQVMMTFLGPAIFRLRLGYGKTINHGGTENTESTKFREKARQVKYERDPPAFLASIVLLFS